MVTVQPPPWSIAQSYVLPIVSARRYAVAGLIQAFYELDRAIVQDDEQLLSDLCRGLFREKFDILELHLKTSRYVIPPRLKEAYRAMYSAYGWLQTIFTGDHPLNCISGPLLVSLRKQLESSIPPTNLGEACTGALAEFPGGIKLDHTLHHALDSRWTSPVLTPEPGFLYSAYLVCATAFGSSMKIENGKPKSVRLVSWPFETAPS